MDASDIQSDLSDVLYTADQIQNRLNELAAEIEADYAGRDLLLVDIESVVNYFARTQFDIVIIDSAPTLAVTDGILIGNLIKQQFYDARDWPFGSVLSIVLTAAAILFAAGRPFRGARRGPKAVSAW